MSNTVYAVNEVALKACLLFASKEETRYYLKGVHIQLKDGQIVYSATDGHRLFQVSAATDQEGEFAIIVPSDAVKRAKKFEAMSYDPEIQRVELGDIITKPIDGNFPDIARAIPEKPGENKDGISVNALYLADFGKAFKLLFGNPQLKVWPNTGIGAPHFLSTSSASHISHGDGLKVIAVLMTCRV